MAIVSIPVNPTIPHQEIQVTLDTVTYTLEIRWSDRESCHYLDVRTEDDSPIASGLKMVLGTILGSRVADPRWPPGILWVTDTAQSDTDAGLEDLGARVQLLYMDVATLREQDA